MIIAHYANRLPENYDLGRIHLARPLLDTLAKGDGR